MTAIMPPWITDTTNLHVGQVVFRFGRPDDAWSVRQLGADRSRNLYQCFKTGKEEWFSAGNMANHPSPAYGGSQVRPATTIAPRAPEANGEPTEAPRATVPAPRQPREKPAGDAIAQILATAKNLDECFVIYDKAKIGHTAKELRAQIGHLSNGLQRMGVGNRLRTAWKHGKFDAEAFLAKVKK